MRPGPAGPLLRQGSHLQHLFQRCLAHPAQPDPHLWAQLLRPDAALRDQWYAGHHGGRQQQPHERGILSGLQIGGCEHGADL